jgi:DNA-binding transcriptional LysR family regulator
MDRLAAMEAFVRVVDAGSFSGAAKQLRIGQPAVSKTIAQLEDWLDVRLLLRSTHRLTPTEAGRNFYDRAKRAIEEADEAELAARGAAATLSGRLRVCGRRFSCNCPQNRTVPKTDHRDARLFRGEGRAANPR